MKRTGLFCLLVGFFLCAWLSACSSQDPLLLKLSQQALAEHDFKAPLPPHEFISDGCSWWPDGQWVRCCVTHDVLYWAGGSSEQRKKADREMDRCISKTGHPIMGKVMYYGVRMGGVYWLPTPYRWGFGWEFPQSGPPGKPY